LPDHNDVPERIYGTGEKYKGKNESYYIDGPYILNENTYWIIHYIKKGFFKRKGVTVIVIDEEGNLIKEWEIYSKILKAYLTPKINKKFIETYEEEYNQLNNMKNYMESIINGKSEFNINKLYEDSKEYKISEFTNALIAIKDDIKDLINLINKILSEWDENEDILNKLLKRNEYDLLNKFAENIVSSETKSLRQLDRELSEHSKLILYLVDLIRELGMRRDISKKVIESINSYIHSTREFKGNIHKMIKLREYIDSLISERVRKIKEYYNEYLSRVSV